MDIKYYRNRTSGAIEAINIDNVKRIYIEWHETDKKSLSTLYFDDIKIHTINKESMENKINEIISSEDKILEIYNSDIIKKIFKQENSEVIFKIGFIAFKEYLQSRDVNFDTVLNTYKLIGIRAYIEKIKAFDVIVSDKVTEFIVGFILCFMYLSSLKKLV